MSEDELDLTAPRRVKLGVIVLVTLLHLIAILALIRAFAPDFTAQAVETSPRPSPSPSPPRRPRPNRKTSQNRPVRRERLARRPCRVK